MQENHTYPNKGRDIGPLITEVGSMLDNRYEVYGHIHTKKSVHIEKELQSYGEII